MRISSSKTKPILIWNTWLGRIGARAQTAYTMELYPVRLTGDFSVEKILGDGHNRWLHAEEIQAALTRDGKPISGAMALLLEMAGLLEN